MANEQCVVRFLLVCLIGFIVMLISNIAGPFDSVPYRVISMVVLGCIVLMGIVYLGKRTFKACRKCKTSKSNVPPRNRARQPTETDEELLNIFPELRRHSGVYEEGQVIPENNSETQQPREDVTGYLIPRQMRLLSDITEVDEEHEAVEEVGEDDVLTEPSSPEEQEHVDPEQPRDEVSEVNPEPGGRSRESSGISRGLSVTSQSSEMSFQSAVMDNDYPPPYDSSLHVYNNVAIDIYPPGDRSTL